MEFRLHVSGDRACFKRVEFAEDLVSYDVITPMAARGVFEAVYRTPGMRWRIDAIQVLKPIRSTWMSLAETDGDDAVLALARIVHGKRDRRMANVLSDVGYVLTAHIDLSADAAIGESASQHEAIFGDRLQRRQFVRQPYLGLRSFPALVAPLPDDPVPTATPMPGAVDLGWMLFDVAGDGSEGPRLFRPIMIDGVIDLRRRDSLILAG